MTHSPGYPLMIVSFLLVIGPLIFLHELGHYFAGRLFGVKAEAFSIGFGREIVGWTDRRGTRWKVGWLPLGGYVRFKGDMNPAGEPSPEWLSLPPEERAETFQGKPLWQRAIIVAAGPVVNLLVAVLIFGGVFAAVGEPRTPPIVGTVDAHSPAAAAGLRAGDRIVSIAGRGVSSFEDLGQTVSIRPGEPVEIRFERAGAALATVATPATKVERDRFGNVYRRGMLGVTASGAPVMRPLAPIEVPGAALRFTRSMLTLMTDSLWQVVSGRRPVSELAGPLKMAQVSGQQATLGFIPFLFFAALISINLGFINLLPIPMLDGGHLLFYLIEAVRRRPLRPQAQEWAFRTGLAALLILMVFVTFNDLASFGLWKKLGGLIG